MLGGLTERQKADLVMQRLREKSRSKQQAIPPSSASGNQKQLPSGMSNGASSTEPSDFAMSCYSSYIYYHVYYSINSSSTFAGSTALAAQR